MTLMLLSLRLLPMTQRLVTWTDACGADVGVAATDVNEAHHHEGEPAAGAQASQSFPKERKGIRKLSQKFENYLTSFSQLSKRKKRNSKTFPKIRKPSPPFQRLRGSLP
jgi:hypothetical protein